MLPGKGFSDGLRIIESDGDTLMMTSVVPKFQFFKLFVTEKNLFEGIDLDDVCIKSAAELPPVISPKPVRHVDIGSTKPSSESDDDSDSNFGSDLIDSDNEIDKDDDDLFDECTEHGVSFLQHFCLQASIFPWYNAL